MRSCRGGDYLDSYAEEWRHLSAVARGQAELQSTVADGVAALRIVRAPLESALRGEPMRFAEFSGAT